MNFEDTLPEKLRNKGILPSPKGNERVTVTLNDQQINVLAESLFPRKKAKGA